MTRFTSNIMKLEIIEFIYVANFSFKWGLYPSNFERLGLKFYVPIFSKSEKNWKSYIYHFLWMKGNISCESDILQKKGNLI